MFSRSAETKVESNVDERRMRKVFMVEVLEAIISVVQVTLKNFTTMQNNLQYP